jgi:hypothetical protein
VHPPIASPTRQRKRSSPPPSRGSFPSRKTIIITVRFIPPPAKSFTRRSRSRPTISGNAAAGRKTKPRPCGWRPSATSSRRRAKNRPRPSCRSRSSPTAASLSERWSPLSPTGWFSPRPAHPDRAARWGHRATPILRAINSQLFASEPLNFPYFRTVIFLITTGVVGWLIAPSIPRVVGTAAMASTTSSPLVTWAKIT